MFEYDDIVRDLFMYQHSNLSGDFYKLCSGSNDVGADKYHGRGVDERLLEDAYYWTPRISRIGDIYSIQPQIWPVVSHISIFLFSYSSILVYSCHRIIVLYCIILLVWFAPLRRIL